MQLTYGQIENLNVIFVTLGEKKHPRLAFSVVMLGQTIKSYIEALKAVRITPSEFQEFAKKHLKEVADVFAKQDMKKMVSDMVASSIKQKNWSSTTYNDNDDFYKMVKQCCKDVMHDNLGELQKNRTQMSVEADRHSKRLEENYDKFVQLLDNKMRGTINNWDINHETRIEADFAKFKDELVSITKEEVKKANQAFFGGLGQG